jgi:repressor LexA
MLNERERAALDYIAAYQRQRGGVSPLLSDIAFAVGGSRTRSVGHRLVTGLERKGFIRRLHNRKQAIEIIKNPISGMREAWFKFDEETKQLTPLKLRL